MSFWEPKEMNQVEEIDPVWDAECELADEEVLVQEWRAEQLMRLGITSIVAEVVAGCVDWHELERLIERGCSPELALEIAR
jgi:hypothetical protein